MLFRFERKAVAPLPAPSATARADEDASGQRRERPPHYNHTATRLGLPVGAGSPCDMEHTVTLCAS